MDQMIVGVDSETTGLQPPMGTRLELCPHIIEIYAARRDSKTGEILEELNTLVKPPIPIPPYITKINGINDEMVKNAPTFMDIHNELFSVFLGAGEMVAANLTFDKYMIETELERIGKRIDLPPFPFPTKNFCVIEQSMHLRWYRLKNSELYEIATGGKIEGIHRAKADEHATHKIYRFLKK